MLDLLHYITKRAQIRSHLTRLNNYLEQTVSSPDLLQIQERITKAEVLWDQFEDIQCNIETLTLDTDQHTLQTGEREQFENQYFSTLSRCKTIISRPNNTIGQVKDSASTDPSINVRLPQINLPIFNGSFEQWLNFSDTFGSLIHTNSSLLPVQKFHYLRSSLTGEAAKCIQNIEISSANYEVAWDLLRSRFENKHLIIQGHIKALFNLQPISKESHIALRQLLDDVLNHLRSLEVLGAPTKHWDYLLIYLVSSRLDHKTRFDWESQFNVLEHSFTHLTEFLARRCQLLESVYVNKQQIVSKGTHSDTHNANQKATYGRYHTSTALHASNKTSCPFCKGVHLLFSCREFLKLSVKNRIEKVREFKLCLNCLQPDHHSKNCQSGNCRTCNKRHNTLLHIPTDTQNQHTEAAHSGSTIATHCMDRNQRQVILSTAIVHILDKFGNKHKCRALLDSGSQSHFITKDLSKKLQLPCTQIKIPVTGINDINIKITHTTKLTIQSQTNSFQSHITCLILPKITEHIPTSSIDLADLRIPNNIKLADPHFDKPAPIELLIGAGLFWDLLCVGQIKLGHNKPILHKTSLGWIVSGELLANSPQKTGCFLTNVAETDLNAQVKRMWQVEEFQGTERRRDAEEENCERHFLSSITRNTEGRYVVSIPFKENLNNLGESKLHALKRLYSLERRLKRDEQLRVDYVTFMDEYLQLGHMSEAEEQFQPNSYYLPHHAVLKLDSLTTRLRVVFDGSAKTTTGISLNDTQMIGSTIQSDLFSIVLRFRQHKYVISADITKMYRQILIQDIQRDYQRILWRRDPAHDIKTYRLNTVTYGTTSAPFLAIRCLHQLAEENKEQYPEISKIIQRDFYVDDLLSGADTIAQTISTKRCLTDILSTAGFELRKWTSNIKELNDLTIKQKMITDHSDSKTLGLIWNPTGDFLQYAVNATCQQRSTKRIILSTIAQIFDPLGLIGPVTIKAKIIIQHLWQLRLDWDETVPVNIHTSWQLLQEQLKCINNIRIPRHAFVSSPMEVELHGFCDASEAAYGACVYVRTTGDAETYTVRLLCARSRVAPLKTLTIPRLELCAAVLLAQLMKTISNTFTVNIDKAHFWCDSTIVLSWLSAPSNRWKTFVANRVAEIQEITNISDWRHVSTADNPADIISRGLDPNQVESCKIWWNGPDWLSRAVSDWPDFGFSPGKDIPEHKATITLTTHIAAKFNIFHNYSTLVKLKNVTAYCLRFIHNARNLQPVRNTGNLTVQEGQQSMILLLKSAQNETFGQEIDRLQRGKPLANNSRLASLNPFLDKDGLLRVGGRIANANIDYNQRHPILLSPTHILTTLIIKHEHRKLLHAGPQAVLSSIRLRYWPLSGRNTVKGVLRQCVICFRVKPVSLEHIMGALPADRVRPSRPFSTCGVDYAGPFLIKEGSRRSRKTIKAYICLFVCFSTKAVHIELSKDLSTEAFLNCFKRFISRRGKCNNIFSDNATNFIGARNELKELNLLLRDKQHNSIIADFLAQDEIQWHLIPPRAPHFGGLWEAAVKSAKGHMKRVVGNSYLTFEELYTVLVQIEACLNSRPLTHLSCDPTDLSPLTPGHFLIGDSLIALPEESVMKVETNRLSHYQRLQQMVQHFWVRWSKDYLHQLQQRYKWNRNPPNQLIPGRLVVLREDNMPPQRWALGRITEIHPGKDGITRVVSVKVSNGEVKRPVSKICLLPIDD